MLKLFKTKNLSPEQEKEHMVMYWLSHGSEKFQKVFGISFRDYMTSEVRRTHT